MVMYAMHDKVNVDRIKLFEAVKKDIISHPKEFASSEAHDFQEDLAGTMPQKDLNDITRLLRKMSDLSNEQKFGEFIVSYLLVRK